MSPHVAVLDANVLYPARLRDLLVRLAITGLAPRADELRLRLRPPAS